LDLAGTLSNRQVQGKIDRTLAKVEKSAAAGALFEPQRPDRRARYRSIQRTVENVLLAAGGPLSIRAVHAGVERELSAAVSLSSVKNALADGAAAHGSPVKRVGRGRYWLATVEARG